MTISTSLRRAVFVFTALVMAPILGAATPFHLRLEKSSPADSSVVAPPTSVKLWFTQETQLPVTRVVVRSAAGDTIPVGAPTRAAAPDSPIDVPFKSAVGPGAYTVDWRTMAADGHVVRGTFRFTVRDATR